MWWNRATGTVGPLAAGALIALAGCGGGEPTPLPPVEIDVSVEEFWPDFSSSDIIDEALLHQDYLRFETALWSSIGANEVLPELRSTVSPDAMGEVEEIVSSDLRPSDGSVEIINPEITSSMSVTFNGEESAEAELESCSDQRDLVFGDGQRGDLVLVEAEFELVDDHFVVIDYEMYGRPC